MSSTYGTDVRVQTTDTSSANPTPEQLRAEVEATQANLHRDVAQLSEKVSPKQIFNRRTDKFRSSAASAGGSMKDKIMGAPSSVASAGGSMTSELKEKAQGNPLAAGLVALGAGWIVGGLLPVTQRERDKAQELEQQAKGEIQPMVDEAKRVVQES